MFTSMITRDPDKLELHIQRSIAAFKDGAKLSALYGIGILLLALRRAWQSRGFSPPSASPPPDAGMPILVDVPALGIHLSKFTFWGRVEFVVMGHDLQLIL